MGIADGTVRLSIGIEDGDDLFMRGSNRRWKAAEAGRKRIDLPAEPRGYWLCG
ncbi:MAG: hypothetical protein IPO35_16665, partial [Uliginosibacterium sp.]|nr:hypothetical protein [Uliginosibacterium sp.]